MKSRNAPPPDPDLGFTYRATKGGDLIISRQGRQVTILRGPKAEKAGRDLEKSSFKKQQQILARLTGNYKRGNEKGR